MRSSASSIGVPEYVLLASLLLVGALMAWGLASGWPLVLLPGLTYVVGALACYTVYRAEVGGVEPVVFEVTAVRGECLLGRKVGERLRVAPGRAITPEVCLHAEQVLRHAAVENGDADVQEWCCPIYDHLLVFGREAVAA